MYSFLIITIHLALRLLSTESIRPNAEQFNSSSAMAGLCRSDTNSKELLLSRENYEKNINKRNTTRRVACWDGRRPKTLRPRYRVTLSKSKER